MEQSTPTAELLSLDESLELLDDVEGFDLLVPEVQEEELVPLDTFDLLQTAELADNSAPLVSEQDEQTTTAKSPGILQQKPPKSTRKIRHRRQQEELRYLRKQVEQLEQELSGLKDEVGSHLSGGDDGNSSSLWERVAKSQRKERLKVEVENMKLRGELEGQLKLARSLETLLRKRPADEALDREDQRTQVRRAGDLVEDVDGLLSSRVDKLFERVDAAMREAGFIGAKRDRNCAQVKLHDIGNVCVEMVDAKISPFPLHDVVEAMWTTLTTQRIELDNGYYKALDCTADIVRAEFCVTLRLRRAEALVRMHILGKRVVEENRVVMVWATTGQTEGAPFGMECVNLNESGWTVVEEIAGGTSIESVVHLTPQLDDMSAENFPVGVLTDLVIGSYGLNMQRMHQVVENRLLR